MLHSLQVFHVHAVDLRQGDLIVCPAGRVPHHVPHGRCQIRRLFDGVFKAARDLPDPAGDQFKADALADAVHRAAEVAGRRAGIVKGFPVPVQAALVVGQFRFQARHCGFCPVQLRSPLLRLFAALAVLLHGILQGTVQALHDLVLLIDLAFQCFGAGLHQLLRVAALLELCLRQAQLCAQVADARLRVIDRPLVRLLSVHRKRCFDLPRRHQLSTSLNSSSSSWPISWSSLSPRLIPCCSSSYSRCSTYKSSKKPGQRSRCSVRLTPAISPQAVTARYVSLPRFLFFLFPQGRRPRLCFHRRPF